MLCHKATERNDMILVLSKSEIWTEWPDPNRSIENSDMEVYAGQKILDCSKHVGSKKDGNRGCRLARSDYKHPEIVRR